MAMPVAARTDWTVELLDALPDDGQRYEIIDRPRPVCAAPSARRHFQDLKAPHFQ